MRVMKKIEEFLFFTNGEFDKRQFILVGMMIMCFTVFTLVIYFQYFETSKQKRIQLIRDRIELYQYYKSSE